jgi:hypothetical protein
MTTTNKPRRRDFLRAMALGAASVAFASRVKEAAAAAAVSDRQPLPKQPPRWIGHF